MDKIVNEIPPLHVFDTSDMPVVEYRGARLPMRPIGPMDVIQLSELIKAIGPTVKGIIAEYQASSRPAELLKQRVALVGLKYKQSSDAINVLDERIALLKDPPAEDDERLLLSSEYDWFVALNVDQYTAELATLTTQLDAEKTKLAQIVKEIQSLEASKSVLEQDGFKLMVDVVMRIAEVLPEQGKVIMVKLADLLGIPQDKAHDPRYFPLGLFTAALEKFFSHPHLNEFWSDLGKFGLGNRATRRQAEQQLASKAKGAHS